MNVMWCDTETTGIEVENSGAFEIALLLAIDGEIKEERTFLLNPLTEKIKYSEESGKIHGVSEEKIRSFEPFNVVITRIIAFISLSIARFCPNQKLVFAGYNCNFDWKHLKALFERCNYKIDDYFDKQYDVYEVVKKAGWKRAIPYLENLKLVTVCKSLGVELNNAHSAMADIKATRNVAIELYKRGIK